MKRYYHLQILVSMLCLAASALRHQRNFAPHESPALLGDREQTWHGGIPEAVTESPTAILGRGQADPAVRYEEVVLDLDEGKKPLGEPNKAQLFAWNSDDPKFYSDKGSEGNKNNRLTQKREGITHWRYFQRHRPAFHTSQPFHDNCPFCK